MTEITLLEALKALVAATEAADNPSDMGVGAHADVMVQAREAIEAAENQIQ